MPDNAKGSLCAQSVSYELGLLRPFAFQAEGRGFPDGPVGRSPSATPGTMSDDWASDFSPPFRDAQGLALWARSPVPMVLYILARRADDPAEAIVRSVNDTRGAMTRRARLSAWCVRLTAGAACLENRSMTSLAGHGTVFA